MPQANFNRKSKGAFTLIEIMVVLVIMGFLVALVAPKLAGIVDSAVDTNCDTNQERLRKVINTYVQQNNALPNGLMNMVVIDDTSTRTAAIPSVSDGDKSNGAEILSDEFDDRFKPQVHYIDQEEADELVGMGIKGFKYIGAVGTGNTPSTDDIIEEGVSGSVAAGVPVMMAGVGIDQAGAALTWATGNTITIAGSGVVEDSTTPIDITAGTSTSATVDGTLTRMDEGKAVGRIIMGVANSGELVQSGMLDESGTCPGQLQHADQFSWGNYMVVVPRLSATMVRLTDTTAFANGLANGRLHAVALGVDSGEDATGNTIVGRTPGTGYQYFAAQEVKDFTTSCPEGHTWGANADAYAIKLD
ncbi:MAG: prepilin-type N-terminal cleavage/methylation domain-containing protein [Campylobacterales bacterium]|nr:prepilin-type N-terminal cleavage/methylation domain-containing protein [Campylobacterales bacterium]